MCSRENGSNDGANVSDEDPGDHNIFVELKMLSCFQLSTLRE